MVRDETFCGQCKEVKTYHGYLEYAHCFFHYCSRECLTIALQVLEVKRPRTRLHIEFHWSESICDIKNFTSPKQALAWLKEVDV